MGLTVTILSAIGVLAAFLNPLWGTCAFVATLVIRPNENVEGVGFPVIPAMIIAMSLVYLLHFVHTGRRLELPKKASNRSLVLMVVMLLILMTHLLIWRREELTQWILGEAAPLVLLVLFATRFMSTPSRLATLYTSLGVSAAVVGGQALGIHFLYKESMTLFKNQFGDMLVSHGKLWDSYHLYHDQDDTEKYSVRLQGRGTGTWGNSNDLGMVCNWSIPVAIYYLRRKGRKLLKIVAVAVALLMMATIFLTGSRGSQLQMGINFWMIFVGGKRKALGIVLLIVALVGALVILPRLSPERSDSTASSDERTLLLEDAMRMFIHNPVKGVGFNNFPDLAFKTLMPHNVYAQCLAETGLVGAVFFFPLIFFLRREASSSVKYFEARPDFNMAMLARCIGSMQFGFLIFMLFTNQFMRFTFALVMCCGMALYVTMMRQRQQEEEQEQVAVDEARPREVPSPLASQRPMVPREEFVAPGPMMLPAHQERAPDLDVEPEESPTGGARYVFDPDAPQEGVRPMEEDMDEDDDDIDQDPFRRRRG